MGYGSKGIIQRFWIRRLVYRLSSIVNYRHIIAADSFLTGNFQRSKDSVLSSKTTISILIYPCRFHLVMIRIPAYVVTLEIRHGYTVEHWPGLVIHDINDDAMVEYRYYCIYHQLALRETPSWAAPARAAATAFPLQLPSQYKSFPLPFFSS
jgi:hypothetical protein